MKRAAFLKMLASAAAVITGPLVSLARHLPFQRGGTGFFVGSGKDRHSKPISPFDGDTFFTKLSGGDTDNSMYIFESTRIKEGGPYLHTHFDQDEFWYVLQGEFLIKVGDKTYNAKPGDFVFGPRKVPHTFAKIGEGEGRVMIGFQPAGKMEEMFKKIAAGVAKNMTDKERDQFRIEHGFEHVGPPLTILKQ